MRKLVIPAALASVLVAGTAGLSLIKQSEGLRQVAYVDPVGIPTVCWGHTGPEVKVGERWSMDRCEAVFALDVADHRAGVMSCVTVPLNQNQQDALTSFAFNFGVTKTCNSTLMKRLNAGDLEGVQREWPKWQYGKVNARAVVLRGLVKRRTAELELFNTPVNPEAQPDLKALVSQTGE